ncbi:helix-turn-helix domain-containing protein [Sporohalobacter salinus]|uniref:helix-turn-helix domain-containing protein n=1 Tax=Sporohalobacter salinus TaxID=1494606 RepID=UPI00195F7634|nr:excisionase family DNA binding protein [Sporohalobacter salinus]
MARLTLDDKVKSLKEIEQLKDEMIEKLNQIDEDESIAESHISFELVVRDVLLKCIENSRKELPFSLTPKDVEELLPVSSTKVYTLLERGEIPARKIDGKWAIQRDQFLAWFHGSTINNKQDELESVVV